MGNKPGKREKIKREYLKTIEKKKKEYFQSHSDLINLSDFRNWKDFIIQEIESVQSKYPDSQWPQLLIAATKSWNAMKDYKWRSNVLWYDYIHSAKQEFHIPSPTVTTILHAPSFIRSDNSFEAQNLQDFLHSHFMQPKEHFIADMIHKFNDFFIRENSEQNENSKITIKSSLKMLVEEIKAFVLLVLQSMVHYYGGMVAKIIEEKPGDMYDLILEEVFSNSLQNLLLQAFFQENTAAEASYRSKLDEYSEITCADLGIEEKFQIDVDNNKNHTGFTKAIAKIKELESNYSPLKKLDAIIATTRLICECVDEYWKDEPSMSKDVLIIDADQILSIFLYIVIKARIFNLKGHLRLIYDFGRKIVQNGQMGYYVTTIEACIIQIENLNAEVLSKFKNY